MTKKRRRWMWILLAIVGLMILGAITGGDDKGSDKTAVERNAPAPAAAEQSTTATTDAAVQTIDDARQAVDDDHYADATTIATAIVPAPRLGPQAHRQPSRSARLRRAECRRQERCESPAHRGERLPDDEAGASGARSYKAATARAAQRRHAVAAAATEAARPQPQSNCDPNYEGTCLDPSSSDYECSGGSGDGPDYTGPDRSVASDPFDLDRDGDGLACES